LSEDRDSSIVFESNVAVVTSNAGANVFVESVVFSGGVIEGEHEYELTELARERLSRVVGIVKLSGFVRCQFQVVFGLKRGIPVSAWKVHFMFVDERRLGEIIDQVAKARFRI